MPERVILSEQSLQGVDHEEEEVGGQGIPLRRPAPYREPFPRDAVEEDGGARHCEDDVHPIAPPCREATDLHDLAQAAPGDRVKGLCEVEFKHGRKVFVLEPALDHLRGVDEVLHNIVLGDEPGLLGVDDRRDLFLWACGQSTVQDLHVLVLQPDGAEIAGRRHAVTVGKRDNERLVDAVMVDFEGVEVVKQPGEATGNHRPGGLVEDGPEAIQPRSVVFFNCSAASLISAASKGATSDGPSALNTLEYRAARSKRQTSATSHPNKEA